MRKSQALGRNLTPKRSRYPKALMFQSCGGLSFVAQGAVKALRYSNSESEVLNPRCLVGCLNAGKGLQNAPDTPKPPILSTLGPRPKAFGGGHTLDRTLRPKPQTLNPEPQNPNPARAKQGLRPHAKVPRFSMPRPSEPEVVRPLPQGCRRGA